MALSVDTERIMHVYTYPCISMFVCVVCEYFLLVYTCLFIVLKIPFEEQKF